MKLSRRCRGEAPPPRGADAGADAGAHAPRPRGRVRPAAVAVASLLACSLHGCDVPHISGYLTIAEFDIATHQLAHWRAQPEYWLQNAYIDPSTGRPAFNSCMNPMLSVVQVCSGHGVCAPFDPNEVDRPIFFCKCDEVWSGLECAERRKRQSVAWVMSMLFGYLGLDELYLGFSQQAMQKFMVSVVGVVVAYTGSIILGIIIFGFSWMFDVVRIGLGPVLTSTHRVQADIPRVAFAVLTIFFFCFVAVAVATAHMYKTVLVRRRHFDHVQCYSSTSTKPLV